MLLRRLGTDYIDLGMIHYVDSEKEWDGILAGPFIDYVHELKEKGIHVMCVCPGWVKTEFMDRAVHDDTVQYYDRWYTAKQVVDRAMRDLKKKKKVSILGAPVRRQVRLVKLLPVDVIMNIWCKQQGKK